MVNASKENVSLTRLLIGIVRRYQALNLWAVIFCILSYLFIPSDTRYFGLLWVKSKAQVDLLFNGSLQTQVSYEGGHQVITTWQLIYANSDIITRYNHLVMDVILFALLSGMMVLFFSLARRLK